jgi:hypothetical protein
VGTRRSCQRRRHAGRVGRAAGMTDHHSSHFHAQNAPFVDMFML